VVEAARREVREETGIEVEITGLSGIYSDPRHVIAYDNGEVRQEFSLCFHAKPVGGNCAPAPSRAQHAGSRSILCRTSTSFHRCGFASPTR
jgi:8-oxo-dGTP pyrophosphatase MutT (NUDIX family)